MVGSKHAQNIYIPTLAQNRFISAILKNLSQIEKILETHVYYQIMGIVCKKRKWYFKIILITNSNVDQNTECLCIIEKHLFITPV